MSDTPEPAEPMTQLAESAAQTHELFTAYVGSGFSRAEALQIVMAILSAPFRPQQQ